MNDLASMIEALGESREAIRELTIRAMQWQEEFKSDPALAREASIRAKAVRRALIDLLEIFPEP